jgi:hypothetical protein
VYTQTTLKDFMFKDYVQLRYAAPGARTIIMNWLSDQDYLAKSGKHKSKVKREPSEEIDSLSTMLSGLVDSLEGNKRAPATKALNKNLSTNSRREFHSLMRVVFPKFQYHSKRGFKQY